MNEEILLFLQRLEYAKQTLISLIEVGANLEKLSKIDKITFGDSGIVLTRDFNPEYFDKLVYVVIDTQKKSFEESKSRVVGILEGNYDEEFIKTPEETKKKI